MGFAVALDDGGDMGGKVGGGVTVWVAVDRQPVRRSKSNNNDKHFILILFPRFGMSDATISMNNCPRQM
jgi:hypothetical protein